MKIKLLAGITFFSLVLTGCTSFNQVSPTADCPDFSGEYLIPTINQKMVLSATDLKTNSYNIYISDKEGVEKLRSMPYTQDMAKMNKEMNNELQCSVMIEEIGLLKKVKQGGVVPNFPNIVRNDNIKMKTDYALFMFSYSGMDFVNIIKTSDVVPDNYKVENSQDNSDNNDKNSQK